ncbi:EamA family transporter [Kitasatospora sp. NPDC086801]|uniref:EamA family transporter n=1 Tax=Kitasatospora sp. NPDC086801 TaxID=3364066 RepID=UPI0037F98136
MCVPGFSPGTSVPAAERSHSQLAAALDYIRSHLEIWEVIFTGGDPLIMAPDRLRPILRALDGIEHVKVIRFHTRVPVVDPDRVTEDLVEALTMDTPVWVVMHTDHSQEIGDDARRALRLLAGSGIPLVSQTVLLKGVNGSPEALEDLFRTLIVNRVKPYYLHHGDLAVGTSHFRTTIGEGQALARSLRGRVSGLCQPTYVLDIPGGHGKVPIGPTYLNGDGTVTDPWGTDNYAATRTPVTTAGVLLNIIPVFGLAFAVALLGERIDGWQYVGAALILAGIFLFSEIPAADADG